MLWFVLSILTAITVAGRDVTVRKLSEKSSAMEIAALELLWSLPFFAVGLFFVEVPQLDSQFWWSFFVSFPLNGSAYLFYIIALTLAPLSLTVPLLSFTPVFVIISGALILGESVNLFGFSGIVLIVLSSYLLNFDKTQKGYLRPIISIFTTKGSLFMFIVALIFSVAGVVGKNAMLHSSPLFFGYFFFFLCNSLILIGILIFKKIKLLPLFANKKTGIWLGSLFLLHIVFHCLAIVGTNASYMISIKRTSILFSVVLGWALFKEKHFRYRGSAALLMFIGAILITTLG